MFGYILDLRWGTFISHIHVHNTEQADGRRQKLPRRRCVLLGVRQGKRDHMKNRNNGKCVNPEYGLLAVDHHAKDAMVN